MNNFHIYRDGKYDRKENLKIKLHDLGQKTLAAAERSLEASDAWFHRLYEVK